MSNKSRKIIIIAIIVLIIAIIGILILLKVTNKKTKVDIIEYEVEIDVNTEWEKVNVRSYYYIVKNIVEKYYLNLCDLNKTAEDVPIYEYEGDINKVKQEIASQVDVEIENTKKAIYGLFGNDYIKENGISIDNLQEKLGNYNNIDVFIKNMYSRDLSEFLKLYLVFGTIIENENTTNENFELMILTDEKNRTFNIYTSDYIEKKNLYELSKEKNFKMDIEEIENRKYNTYEFEVINDQTYVVDLLDHYIQSVKYLELKYSYNKLDEEYKEKKFDKETDYEKYIEENKKRITTAILNYYRVDKYDDYKQYICIDRLGNYYIFRESANMDYTVLLDSYTIDLPEFIEKYNNATTEEKVAMNIEKIVEALNAQDYNYVYGKLADEFKENYFSKYEDFEKYAKNTFSTGNEIAYNSYTETQNVSTYNITLKGNKNTITKTVVMKLEEGTDFVMSFNIE